MKNCKKNTKELENLVNICHTNIQNSSEVLNYLKNRGIDNYLAVGISGRCLFGRDQMNILNIPKYKNSSYKKSEILYGLNNSYRSIIEKDSVFIVEGYFDQISMYKNGIDNSVAICGTAFSKNHFLKLRRFASKIYFILDNDDAGIRSISSINKKFSKYGTQLKYLKVSNDDFKDIDEFFRSNTLNDFKKQYKITTLF